MPNLSSIVCDMQDRLVQIERLARNANWIMQEVQEEYFECNNINDERSFVSIFNGFERTGVKVDVIADIIVSIFELADIDLDEIEAAEKEGAKDE